MKRLELFGCVTQAQRERAVKWLAMEETWMITSVKRSLFHGVTVKGSNFTGTVEFKTTLLASLRLRKGEQIRIHEGDLATPNLQEAD